MRFLVVDDDFETRHIVQKILHPYGTVDVATNGEEGVASFIAALQEQEPYDLITMDILMPHSNGQQAIKEIREIEKENNISKENQVKIIMISGLSNSEQVHEAFFLGDAISYIVKPIVKDVLLEEINKLNINLIK